MGFTNRFSLPIDLPLQPAVTADERRVGPVWRSAAAVTSLLPRCPWDARLGATQLGVALIPAAVRHSAPPSLMPHRVRNPAPPVRSLP